ncbi:hypothetical protein ACFSQJ_00105 [Croceitalea marina]|uniref:Secretion system C-terminal sorting domain-containing protein n=1 Tax=Croceitalea marina TaxID=1775166 RepID=A0ABW5MQV4_9FLAO
MKTILKNSVAAAILLSSTLSMANGPEKEFGKKGISKNEVEKNIINFDFDPTFKRKGDKLFMNLLNLDKEKVIITVIDSEGRVVFKEVIKNAVVVEKAFNFENAFEDKYTVVITDSKETFQESVVVKGK